MEMSFLMFKIDLNIVASDDMKHTCNVGCRTYSYACLKILIYLQSVGKMRLRHY